MSSLPFISHHLFVAAVERERRPQLELPRNRPEQESASSQTTAVELPNGEISLDRVVDIMSGSTLVSET